MAIQILKGIDFITSNKWDQSKYSDEERGRYCNWLKHNKGGMR